jgi:hypothetical protein
MKPDFESLHEACFAAARGTMWDVRPTDVTKIKDLADSFFSIAMSHLNRIREQGCDPDILVRAVAYMANTHAIPPMHDSKEWFIFMIAALLELACPECVQNKESVAIFSDIEKGISFVRQQLEITQAGKAPVKDAEE